MIRSVTHIFLLLDTKVTKRNLVFCHGISLVFNPSGWNEVEVLMSISWRRVPKTLSLIKVRHPVDS